MTLIILPSQFVEFRTYLNRNGFKFEERPYQAFLAKKKGIAINLYLNGKIVIGGTDQAEINQIEDYLASLKIEVVAKEKVAHVSYDSQLMTIITPYIPEFVEELKTLTKSRRWNQDKKIWTCLRTERDKVIEIMSRFFTVIEDNTPNYISEYNTIAAIHPPSMTPLEIQAGDQLKIWTDGACSINPGPGGYAAIIANKGQRTEIVGGFSKTTNNRMEIMAVIAALATLKVECKVEIFSDSAYLINSMSKGWAKRWAVIGWVRNKKRVPNWDLWEKLLNLSEKHKVTFIWIKGHNLQAENERCDELAEAITRRTDLPVDTGYNELTDPEK
jgi:ribonuclease HI